MIRYNLTCDQGHEFDSWFQSADAYEALAAKGRVTCMVCGSSEVRKALMAPAVKSASRTDEPGGPLVQPASPLEQAVAAMRRHIEENSDYVGMNFAAEARAIHAGEAPERPIHGEAHRDEARKLIEDGIPVAPLPFLPSRRVN